MSFIFPLALGALAVLAVPILIHLLYRQKPRTIRFPAFRFLLQKQRKNLRSLRLRHLLLLALRLLILAALVLVLARPWFYTTGTGPAALVLVFDTGPRMGYRSADGTTRLDLARKRAQELVGELHPESKVLVLETGGTPFAGERTRSSDWKSRDDALKTIADLEERGASRPLGEPLRHGLSRLKDLAGAPDAKERARPRYLCVFSDRTAGSWQADDLERDAVADAIHQIPPTYEGLQDARGDLPGLVDLLKELRTRLPPSSTSPYPDQSLLDALQRLQGELPSLTQEDVPSAAEKLAPVATILSKGRTLLGLLGPFPEGEKDAAAEYRERLVKQLGTVMDKLRGVRCSFFDVGLSDPVDLAIVRLKLPGSSGGRTREVFRPDEAWTLEVVVRASGPASGEALRAKVVCKIPWKSAADPLEETMDFLLGQEKTVPFLIDNSRLRWEGGFAQLEVALEPEKGKGPLDRLPFSDKKFLTVSVREPRGVLVIADDEKQALPFQLALQALGHNAEVKISSEAARLDKLDFPAVFLFQVAQPGKKLWDLLEGYVGRGGGLGVVPGGEESLGEDEGSYGGPVAKRLLPGRFRTLVDEKGSARWDLADESIYLHRLMRPFRDWRGSRFIDFFKTFPEAYRYWEVEPGPASQVLVHYADEGKRPALLELPSDLKAERHGKVLLFTAPLDAREKPWTNYLESSFYIVLIGLSTEYLIGGTPLNFSTDRLDPLFWPVPTERGFLGYRLTDPRTKSRNLAPPEGNLLVLSGIGEVGNYRLEGLLGEGAKKGAKEVRIGAFSVNLPPREVDLARLDAGRVRDVFGADAVHAVGSGAGKETLLQGYQSSPLELLPFLLLLVLFLLAGENLLANLFYRKEKQPEEIPTEPRT